jgi:hypothetical protein
MERFLAGNLIYEGSAEPSIRHRYLLSISMEKRFCPNASSIIGLEVKASTDSW